MVDKQSPARETLIDMERAFDALIGEIDGAGDEQKKTPWMSQAWHRRLTWLRWLKSLRGQVVASLRAVPAPPPVGTQARAEYDAGGTVSVGGLVGAAPAPEGETLSVEALLAHGCGRCGDVNCHGGCEIDQPGPTPETKCQFDNDGDGNCAMPTCPVCRPELQPVPGPTPEGRETLSDEHAADIIQLVREKERAIRDAKAETLREVRDAVSSLRSSEVAGRVVRGMVTSIIDGKLAALTGGTEETE